MNSSGPTLRIFKGDEKLQENPSSQHIPLVTSDKTDPITLELMKLAQYPEQNWNYRSSALHILRWLQTLIPAVQKIDHYTSDRTQNLLLELEREIGGVQRLTIEEPRLVYESIQRKLNSCWRDIRNCILLNSSKGTQSITHAPREGACLLRVFDSDTYGSLV